MAHFWRIKDPVTGRFEMKQVDLPLQASPLGMNPMNSVTIAPSARHACAACTPPRVFPTAAIMASHFNRTHKELVLDKDTWRKYDKGA